MTGTTYSPQKVGFTTTRWVHGLSGGHGWWLCEYGMGTPQARPFCRKCSRTCMWKHLREHDPTMKWIPMAQKWWFCSAIINQFKKTNKNGCVSSKFLQGGYLGQKTPTLLVTSDLPRARHQDASSVPVRGLYLWDHWPSAPGPWPPHLSRRSPVPVVEECSSPLSRYPGWRRIVWIPRNVRVPDAQCFCKYTATGYYHRATPETTTRVGYKFSNERSNRTSNLWVQQTSTNLVSIFIHFPCFEQLHFL